jgi:alpha-L-fucosidase
MLSISPKADGTIPAEQQHILCELGNWLKVNGEGIYGTRKWKIETEGPVDKFLSNIGGKVMWNFEGKGDAHDIRFTRKGNRLFAFLLDWPHDGSIVIKSFGRQTKVATNGISGVRLLGHTGRLQWTRHEESLVVDLPKRKPCDYAFGLEIEVDGELLY